MVFQQQHDYFADLSFLAVHLRQQTHHGIADGVDGGYQRFPFVTSAPNDTLNRNAQVGLMRQ